MQNPYQIDIRYENDIEGFKMPWQIYSKLDATIMANRYMQLRKKTTAYNVRLGVYSDAQS